MTLYAAPSAADVQDARARITPHIVRTPMLRNAALDARTGATILIKPEVLQRTGSFKLRGATNALLRLSPAQLKRGVVAYSSGNHAQAIACAAQRFGTSATIVMPSDAPAIKRAHTAFWGAKIVPYDRLSENREAIAAAIVAQTGAALIPPYEHPDVIAGQGTLALELAEDAQAAGLTMDALLVCVGGGGLIAGCALALSDVSPTTKIYAAEPAGWDDTARSLKAGKRLGNDMQGSKFCDALLTPIPGALTFSINSRLVTAGLSATDDAVRTAIDFARQHLKLVVEPGGAVALAALLSNALPTAGLTIGITLSGGNAD
ncbi:MAG: pyridoxal-5'-phosphate-dependent protein [Acidocella sp. 20-57-95]|nr:MAG: pyridoxal-5'-phosphate-dependent protein [Acidocella sp. 20-57-95]OYV62312.1 MAG: pyridoxal-5'-phosphate-dependent protein [Acidocella sp. 21-58-7]HQT63964.1 threonine/serine dehydratase [Acidocella sp.]HQU03253.1 threonine/serine dehydratase [Acidocella sp.]